MMKPRTFPSMAKAMKWLAKHGRGRALHLAIMHDDWCPSGTGGRGCTCTPHVMVDELTAETVQRGEREEREWLSRHERN